MLIGPKRAPVSLRLESAPCDEGTQRDPPTDEIPENFSEFVYTLSREPLE